MSHELIFTEKMQGCAAIHQGGGAHFQARKMQTDALTV